jgi:hypothetical protein
MLIKVEIVPLPYTSSAVSIKGGRSSGSIRRAITGIAFSSPKRKKYGNV